MSNSVKQNIRIGVIMVTLVDTYQHQIFSGIQRAAAMHNINLVCIEDKQPEDFFTRKNAFPEQLSHSNLDAIIVFSAVLEIIMGKNATSNYLNSLGNVPIICIGSPIEGFPCLETDNNSGVRQLVKHLIEDHGCMNIAYLAGPQQNTEAQLRYSAYKSVLEEYGLEFNEDRVFYGNFEPGDGVIAVKTLLDERKQTFDALMCVDDHSALGVMEELEKRGISIPDQVIVTGFDDIENCEFSKPGLTTVHQPLFEIGFESVKYALKAINEEEIPSSRCITTPLVLRGSCGCSNIRYFHDQTDIACIEDLTNEDLAKEIEKQLTDGSYKNLIEKSYAELYDDAITYLLENCVTFLKTHNEKALWEIIQDFVDNTFESGKNGMFWIRTIYPLFQQWGTSVSVTSLWSRLTSLILLADHHYKGRERLNEYNLKQQLTGLLNFVVSGSSRQKLIDQLNHSLPRLGIGDLQLVLYDEDKFAKIFILFSNGKITEPQNSILEKGQLLCDELNDHSDKSFYIFPLYAQKELLGSLTVEANKLNYNFYHDLNLKLTHGIEGMLLMEKINSYTSHLEDEIRKRTDALNTANKQLLELSYIDHLSALKNRRFLNDVIKPEAEQHARKYTYHYMKNDKRNDLDMHPFGLFLVDLDHFKMVNDDYGHKSGDMVIKQLSEIFMQQCREDDFVVRIGGEEFLLILRNFDTNFMIEKGNRIRQAVKEHAFKIDGGKEIFKTCSVGCFTYPALNHPEIVSNLATAISMADKALYYAKENGRDKAVYIKLSQELTPDELQLFLSTSDSPGGKVSYISRD